MVKSRFGSQSGAGAVNLIMVTTFSMAAVYAVSTQISGALKLRAGTDASASYRQRHESALQLISQLVNTGALAHQGINGNPTDDFFTASDAFKVTNACAEIQGSAPKAYQPKSNEKWCMGPVRNTFVVRICETNPNKDAPSNSSRCATGQREVLVRVAAAAFEDNNTTAEGFTQMVARSYVEKNKGGAVVKEEFTSKARIRSYLPNKLDNFVADTDFCYFMRPASDDQQQAKYQSGTLAGDIQNLKPREEGTGPGKFKQQFNLGGVETLKDPSAYEVLKELRSRLQEKYKEGFRTTSIRGSDSKINNVFVGVMPKNDKAEFQYFLAANNTVGHRTNVTKWPDTGYKSVDPQFNQTWESELKYGCQTTTGANYGDEKNPGPDFCTRVHVPYKSYESALSTRCERRTKMLTVHETTTKKTVCKLVPNTPAPEETKAEIVNKEATAAPIGETNDAKVEAKVTELENNVLGTHQECTDETEKTYDGEKFSVNLKDQVVCNESWPDQVTSIVSAVEPTAEEYGKPWNTKKEVLIGEYIAVADLYGPDLEAMQARHGGIVASAVASSVNGVLRKLNVGTGPTASGTVKGELRTTSLRQLADDASNAVIEYTGSATLKTVNYYVQVQLSTPEATASHNAMRCAYFRYYEADKPQKCKIDVLTQGADANGWWVCRTNDGCFDTSTRIRLADGSEKAIVDLKQGDLVYNPRTGKSQEISHLTIGPEKETMYRIGFAGRVVEVTKTHPFFTEQGWAAAQNLRLGSLVLDEGNAFRKLEVFEPFRKENPPTVVNLLLKGDAENADEHFVLANGVITGDLLIQNKLEKGEIK